MDIEAIKTMHPMVWIIIVAAIVICSTVLFNKAIKFVLKLAVIGVAILFVVYFLVQANVIVPPTFGK